MRIMLACCLGDPRMPFNLIISTYQLDITAVPALSSSLALRSAGLQDKY